VSEKFHDIAPFGKKNRVRSFGRKKFESQKKNPEECPRNFMTSHPSEKKIRVRSFGRKNFESRKKNYDERHKISDHHSRFTTRANSSRMYFCWCSELKRVLAKCSADAAMFWLSASCVNNHSATSSKSATSQLTGT